MYLRTEPATSHPDGYQTYERVSVQPQLDPQDINLITNQWHADPRSLVTHMVPIPDGLRYARLSSRTVGLHF